MPVDYENKLNWESDVGRWLVDNSHLHLGLMPIPRGPPRAGSARLEPHQPPEAHPPSEWLKNLEENAESACNMLYEQAGNAYKVRGGPCSPVMRINGNHYVLHHVHVGAKRSLCASSHRI